MTKRSRPLLAVVAAAALVVTACGGDDDDSAETVEDTADTADTAEDTADTAEDTAGTADTAEDTADTADTADTGDGTAGETLLIWADERKVAPLEAVAPAFTEATGVEVVVELVDFGTLRDQVQQAAPAGEGPDIFSAAHDWTGELAANGIIDPIDVSAIQDEFVPVGLQGFNFEGRNYAIPYVTEAVAMYRNTALIPEAPATWDDLIAACDAAAVENCVVVPGGGDATDAYHNYPFISAFGGYVFAFDESTGFDASQVGLDTPEGLQGGEFLESQVTAGVIASTNYDTAKNLFLEGSAAAWITGPWELGVLRDQTAIEWDVSVIPQIGDRPTQPFVGAQGFMLSSFSENPLLAQSFLVDFLATDEVMQALYDADPRGTAWGAVQETLSADPQVAAFDASASNGVPMPNIPQMASVWGPLGDNLLLVRNGSLGGDEALETAAAAVRSAVSG